MNQYKPGQAQPQQQSQGEPYQAYIDNANMRLSPRPKSGQQQSQGTPYQAYTPNANERPQYGQQPSAPRRPDFAPPQSDFRQVGEAGAAVMTRWYNPQTGQTHQTGASNYQPVEGSGWVRSPRGGQQPGGDTMYAGGTPYFNERTGQATPNWSAPQGANERISPMQPPPFQMAPAQTPWGASMDPFAERDAFVNQINQQRMQNQIAFNSGGPTNPAAGMNPGIDYQLAMQQAGLAGGAPSMSPEYGDSLIARLNSQFGGQGDPFAFANQRQPMTGYNPGLGGVQAPPKFDGIYAPGTDITKLPLTDDLEPNPAYRPAGQGQSPFVNAQGDLFAGSMSFAPGTPEDYRTQAYGNFANRNGYYQQPAYYPGGTMNDGYGMGGQQGPAPGYGTPPELRGGIGTVMGFPDINGDGVDDRDQGLPGWGAPQRRTRSINEIAGDFYDPNPGSYKPMVVSYWHNPQTGEEFSGTGLSPRPGTGWVGGKFPLSRLRDELDKAERDAASPPRMWDEAKRTWGEAFPGAAEQYAQQAEGLRRQIAEMEAQGSPQRPQGTAGYEYGNYGLPSQAIPIAPPSQGTPYRPTQPAYQPPAEGTIRVDPGTGKAVTYSNGQWKWRPNPVSGVVSYDVSRFGDGPPAPPPRQPSPPPRPAEDDFFVGNWGMMPPSRPSQANPVAPPSRGTPYENPFAQPGRSLHSSEQAEAMRQMQQTGITYPPGLSAKQKSAFNERIRQSQQAVAGYPAGRSGRRDMKRNQALAR
jgi:hypothetical protein